MHYLSFAKNLDTYITEWRDVLEDKADKESDYLILSDDGVVDFDHKEYLEGLNNG